MTRPARRIAGLVLAGGEASRMRTDKAGLILDGRSLLDRARDLLRAADCDPVRVSGKPELADGLADSHPGGGPAHAILDGLEALPQEHDGFFVIPVDMPGLTADDLHPLARQEDAQAVSWRGYQLPLFMSARAVAPARDDIWSIRRLMSSQTHVELDLPAGVEARFRNLNTPEEFNAFRSSR